jgi:hypothetical protein
MDNEVKTKLIHKRIKGMVYLCKWDDEKHEPIPIRPVTDTEVKEYIAETDWLMSEEYHQKQEKERKAKLKKQPHEYESHKRQGIKRHMDSVTFYNFWLRCHTYEQVVEIYNYGSMRDKISDVLKALDNGDIIEVKGRRAIEWRRMSYILRYGYEICYSKVSFKKYVEKNGSPPCMNPDWYRPDKTFDTKEELVENHRKLNEQVAEIDERIYSMYKADYWKRADRQTDSTTDIIEKRVRG